MLESLSYWKWPYYYAHCERAHVDTSRCKRGELLTHFFVIVVSNYTPINKSMRQSHARDATQHDKLSW